MSAHGHSLVMHNAPTDRERDSRLVRAGDVILANATRVQVFVPVHVLGTTQWRTTSLANLSRRDRQAMLRQWRDHGLLGAVALEAGASS